MKVKFMYCHNASSATKLSDHPAVDVGINTENIKKLVKFFVGISTSTVAP